MFGRCHKGLVVVGLSKLKDQEVGVFVYKVAITTVNLSTVKLKKK